MQEPKRQNKHVLEVSTKEMLLLFALRNKFQYGEVIILMRDGQPVRIKQAWTSDDLEHGE